MAGSHRTDRDGLTRRQVIGGAGALAALAITGGGVVDFARGRAQRPAPGGATRLSRGSGRMRPGKARPLPALRSVAIKPAGPVGTFHSEPDLHPPTVTAAEATAVRLSRADDGFLFLGPGPVSLSGSQQYGPLIVDPRGQPIWFRALRPGLEVTNFACSRYRGEPVLVWWQGKVYPSGYGRGEAVLLDRSYREIVRVRAANGRSMDMHALWLTSEGTALFTCHPDTVTGDLTSVGGPHATNIFESIIQEVEIGSGELLFEWQSLQHIPVSDSYLPVAEPYDYLHPNSIQVLPDGNLLISARHTWALYKLDRRSGTVIWKLGGRHSGFAVDPAARFAWQHDAVQSSKTVLTLFDNGTDGATQTQRQSRGLVLNIDEARGKVSLRGQYTSPQRLQAGAMGSVQILPSGRVLVGWGVASQTSEFAQDGTPLVDLALPAGLYSYRGLRLPWEGTPEARPALALRRDRTAGTTLAYASWNGATGIAGWQVDAGTRRDRLTPVGVARKRGFETAIPLNPRVRFVSVTALDRAGRRLRQSHPVAL